MPDPVPEELSRFAAWSVRPFRALLVGGVFTFLSMQMAAIARAWLAFELTGTNTALGGVLIGFGLSSIVAIPAGGVIADRFPKRAVIATAGILQTAMSAGLAVAIATDVIAYWMLVVASVVQGAFISLLGPARLAFIAEVVDRRLLTNAVFLSQTSLQAARVVGPAVAGALISVDAIGVGGAYWTATVLAAAGVAAALVLPALPARARTGRSPWGDLADGIRHVRRDRRLGLLLVLSFLVVLIGFPHVAFLPTYAEEIFGAGSVGFGILNTAAAVGAVASSLALAGVHRSRLWRYQVTAAGAFGLLLVVLGFAPAFWVAVGVMVLIGAASAAFQALNNSLILGIAPVEYHGRVQSLLMLSFTGFGLAALPLGAVADAAGLRPTFAGMGLAVALVVAVSAGRGRGAFRSAEARL
ncbi:MAG: MFS transporter [Actinomyces sp.]|nr:MAG: MFS transporter [Actinomyces sp.]